MKHKHRPKEYKQCLLVRQDLGMSTGKIASQSAHASVEAVLRSDKQLVKQWRFDGMKKIILAVKNEEELLGFKKKAEESGLLAVMITDAGKTEISPGTLTCLAIGPDDS